ncbi:MAG: hypothetical protein JO159_12960 [Acidobacteria bacterium]|nr:hypothetical protein [Acidobacteriota bacterium]MBV9624739.1 hypothetical protein [Acidobacteriota bacterium]
MKTDRECPNPGFTKIDLVAHAGAWAEGDSCHSLNLIDINSTAVETRLFGKGRDGVRQALPGRIEFPRTICDCCRIYIAYLLWNGKRMLLQSPGNADLTLASDFAQSLGVFVIA